MKLQANELPLMKNQTRRKAPNSKIAPLIVLALFLLTIVPIYYPLLRYSNKNSSDQPSSSSRISFQASIKRAPLCGDDLSRGNGDCSHEDVEKTPTKREQESMAASGRDVDRKPNVRDVAADNDSDAETMATNNHLDDLVTSYGMDSETLPRKQNPGRDVEIEANNTINRDLVIAQDTDDETLPRKQKLDKDEELKPDLNNHDTDLETLPRKHENEFVDPPDLDNRDLVTAHHGRDVAEKQLTDELVSTNSGKDGDRVATSSNQDSVTTQPDKDSKTKSSTSNQEKVTTHRRRDVGRSSTHNNRVSVPQNLPVNKSCDIFSGTWVPNPEAPYYTNFTCSAIQAHQNCMQYGRPDTQYLKWRWKPNGCELPIFDPYKFLELMRGKSLAFVGDSVARNHMQSLICLLSRVEEPMDVSEIPYGSQFKRYEYKNHNFAIEIFWSPYLVRTTQTDPADSGRPFNLFLDEFDEKWTSKIGNFDYLVMSAGHWFFRPTMFYVEGRVVGCLYCPESNINHLTTYFSYRRAFRTAFRAINSLENYKGITFLRTFAPSHFEGGYWDKGGDCVRKRPFRNNESRLEGYNLELYKIQMEELKIAERLGRGRRRRLKFRLFDVTEAMLLRPDGHPSKYGHWPQAKVSLANDCVHWCLPGPIDSWNDFFLELLKREDMEN